MAEKKRKTPTGTQSVDVQYPEQINAHYSNRVQLFISNSDIILDFMMAEPPVAKAQKAVFQARIILSPQHAKQFSIVLSENIKNFEEMFGPISTVPIKK